MISPSEATYLGDGLYAKYDGWQIELYVSNGVSETNRVYLEPSVLQAFQAWVKRLDSKAGAQ